MKHMNLEEAGECSFICMNLGKNIDHLLMFKISMKDL